VREVKSNRISLSSNLHRRNDTTQSAALMASIIETIEDAPTNELGRGVSTNLDFTGLNSWGQWIDDAEHSPDLKWPVSVETYDNQRNDAQCQGLYLGATAAIVRYGWYINPNECDTAYVDLLAADLNLPVGEDAAREQFKSGQKRAKLRTQKRFSWYSHLQTALKAMAYGHFYFEQVGEITSEGPGGRQVWRLRKLGPRHPRTITEINVAQDGGLVFIVQGYGDPAPSIPIDRLVCYVWDQEPGNWVGRSIFRPMYRNWIVKDRLLRVDAIKHERNGVGMPVIEAPEGGGGAVPFGTKLRLVGTEGSLPDTIASIRFHNEEMARSMLMMFMQLGQTESGSRALGQTFLDWFSLQQEMIADWIADTATEHIVEDWWSWNVDAEALQTPQLAYIKGPESDPNAQDFGNAQLPNEIQLPGTGKPKPKAKPKPAATAKPATKPTQARSLHPAPGTGAHHSGRTDPSLTGTGDPSPPVGGTTAIDNERLSAIGALDVVVPPVLPSRQLRRQVYEHELQAGTDFNRIEAAFLAGQRNLTDAWMTGVRPRQVSAVGDAIRSTNPSNAAALGQVAVPVLGEDVLFSAMALAAQDSLSSAQSEMIAQGVSPPDVDVDEAALRSRARGMASMLASSLSDSARRNALRMSSGAISAGTLADEVTNSLNSLSDSWLLNQLGAAISAAVNQSRLAVFTSGDGEKMFASEILDTATCGPCIAIDGKLLSRTEASMLYASGSYIYCDGHERCRGTIVATFG
jgi:hypothetical protein